MATEYEVRELASLADVTVRTVHYYIQHGLLHPPRGAKRGARYGEDHVERLLLIKRLKDTHLPLVEIKRTLDSLSSKEIQDLVTGQPEEVVDSEPPPRTAADYVESVLKHRKDRPRGREEVQQLMCASLPEPSRRAAHLPVRTRWERIEVVDGLEVHVSSMLQPDKRQKVELLIEEARRLLGEDEQ